MEVQDDAADAMQTVEETAPSRGAFSSGLFGSLAFPPRSGTVAAQQAPVQTAAAASPWAQSRAAEPRHSFGDAVMDADVPVCGRQPRWALRQR